MYPYFYVYIISDEDDVICIMAPGIITWRNAVKTSGTFSRLHVLLGILDSCIRWEKSSENAVSLPSFVFKSQVCQVIIFSIDV